MSSQGQSPIHASKYQMARTGRGSCLGKYRAPRRFSFGARIIWLGARQIYRSLELKCSPTISIVGLASRPGTERGKKPQPRDYCFVSQFPSLPGGVITWSIALAPDTSPESSNVTLLPKIESRLTVAPSGNRLTLMAASTSKSLVTDS